MKIRVLVIRPDGSRIVEEMEVPKKMKGEE